MSSLRFVIVYLVIGALAAVQSFGHSQIDYKALRHAALSHVEGKAK